VFAFVSNSENLPRWRATALEIKKTFEEPLGVDTGTRGTYYFDAFESRWQTYIGP